MAKIFHGPDPKVKPRGPKRTVRTVDKGATRRAVAAQRECFCGGTLPGCNGVAETGHHIIPRSQLGDDVPANIAAAAGDGVRGCHGLIEANDEAARRALGEHLVLARQDTLEYVRSKLGVVAGDDWLARRLFIT